MKMIQSVSLTLFTFIAGCQASTFVSVLDFGGNNVRGTGSSGKPETSVHGVVSFWGALNHHRLQDPGMTVVPDLFGRPDASLVIGLTGNGVDLEGMPTVQKLLTSKDETSKGHMVVDGQQGQTLLNKIGPASSIEDPSKIISSCKQKLQNEKISALSLDVNTDNASDVDAQIANLIAALKSQNVLVHLVVEEEEGAARRRLSQRRLEQTETQEEAENEVDDNEDGNDDKSSNTTSTKKGFDGYGYYEDGVWVTRFKSMHEIHFYNLVLWTAVGLFSLTFFTVYLMATMPLEADTLLFGESAKTNPTGSD